MQQQKFILATEHERGALSELDYLLCRNVEVFTASEEDVRDNVYEEESCDAVFVGQVGLRCMHCSLSPFATAKYANVFPTNVIQIGSALRMMAKWHFSSCSMAPIDVRKNIERLLNAIENSKKGFKNHEDESMHLLQKFLVSIVTKRFKLENLPTCGIIFSNSREYEWNSGYSQQIPIRRNTAGIGEDDYLSSSSSYYDSQNSSFSRQCHASQPHRAPSPLPLRSNADRQYFPIQHPHQLMLPPIDPIPLHLSNLSPSQQNIPFQSSAPNPFYQHINASSHSYMNYLQHPYTMSRMYQPSTQHTRHGLGATSLDAALRYLTSVSN